MQCHVHGSKALGCLVSAMPLSGANAVVLLQWLMLLPHPELDSWLSAQV
jgi:hypothetical protein